MFRPSSPIAPNALNATGMKTIGEIREASDATLLSLQNCAESSVAHLRETLGLPSAATVWSIARLVVIWRARSTPMRIPEKATTLSGAWRPRDPVDDDQGGARA
jgi:hypothetical protein